MREQIEEMKRKQGRQIWRKKVKGNPNRATQWRSIAIQRGFCNENSVPMCVTDPETKYNSLCDIFPTTGKYFQTRFVRVLSYSI